MIFLFQQSIKVYLLILCFSSLALANSPGTPSSSYGNDYYYPSKKFNEIVDDNTVKQIPKATQSQIIIQGNKRLENELILRASEIEQTGTSDKSLSLAIKKLFKTGYFEDVKIFKNQNIIYINVKENPIIDQISIEGNKEITDDIILEEITTKSRNVFSTDQIKIRFRKNSNTL